MVLVDTILPAQDYGMLTVLGIGMVVLVVAQVILGYLRSTLALYLEARLDVQVMLGFFEHILMLPFRFFQERTSGDLLMRLGSIAVIRDALTSQMVSAILDGVLVVFYLIILLIWWPLFGLITLIFGAAQVLLLWRTTGRLYELTERDLAAQAESQSYLVEALTGMATLKASAAEDRALDHWSNLFFKQLNISLKRNHLMTLVDTGARCHRITGAGALALDWRAMGAQWTNEPGCDAGRDHAGHLLFGAACVSGHQRATTATHRRAHGAHRRRTQLDAGAGDRAGGDRTYAERTHRAVGC